MWYMIAGTLAAVIWSAVKCSVETPQFVGDIESVIASPGDEVVLNCTVTGLLKDLDQSVIWSFMDPATGGKVISNGVMLYSPDIQCSENARKYEVIQREFKGSSNHITYTLLIRCIDKSDAGVYRCSIWLPGVSVSSWHFQNGTLIVKGI